MTTTSAAPGVDARPPCPFCGGEYDAYLGVIFHANRCSALSQPAAGEGVPVGWKLVPREPTDAMTFVGQNLRYDSVNSIGEIYRRMLAATPTPPVVAGEVDRYRDMDTHERAVAMADACAGDPWELLGYFREKLRQSEDNADRAKKAAIKYAKEVTALRATQPAPASDAAPSVAYDLPMPKYEFQKPDLGSGSASVPAEPAGDVVEALQFYADVSKYLAPLTGGMGALWSDCGETARAALRILRAHPRPSDAAADRASIAEAEKPQAWGDIECSGCTLPRRDCECN